MVRSAMSCAYCSTATAIEQQLRQRDAVHTQQDAAKPATHPTAGARPRKTCSGFLPARVTRAHTTGMTAAHAC
jgi:hypothetical protein